MDGREAQITTEVRADRAITEVERALLKEWVEAIFGEEEAKYEWAPQHWHVLVHRAGDLACHAGVTEHRVLAGGARLKVAGIGGVMTPPEWRGQGLGVRAMQVAAGFMRDELKVDFGHLLCSEGLVPYYQELGWQLVQGPVEFDQPSGKVVWDEEAMVLPCRKKEWPPGIIDLCGPPW
jgi:GNAT superfamily N-acetyltransferase